MKKTILATFILFVSMMAGAQNWDHIQTSGEYYWGVGTADTEAEAQKVALADVASQIVTYVSADFTQIDDVSVDKGSVEHKSKVLQCVNTYSQAMLSNVQKWTVNNKAPYTVRCYIHKDELYKIYEQRINKAKDMAVAADGYLQKGKIDLALQYNYWSYSLLRSLQFPNKVKDDKGNVMVNRLPMKIEEILSDIDAKFEKREGDNVDILFTYLDKPVSSLIFNYNDGISRCTDSRAKDGRGMMEMDAGYTPAKYHIDIEYKFKGQARGDAELESVLAVISDKTFRQAEIEIGTIAGDKDKKKKDKEKDSVKKEKAGIQQEQPEVAETPVAVDEYEAPRAVMQGIIKAIQQRDYSGNIRDFTLDGLEIFNRLIAYGKARIVGTPDLKFYKSTGGRVVVRGLDMSFTFDKGTKKTFVEDVIFTFDKDNKVENIAFGLGDVAERDILNRDGALWTPETREMLMEFLENYKTAYCLERLDYLNSIFSNDAVIIVGNVVRRRESTDRVGSYETGLSIKGREIINYNRYDKETYMANLSRCFNNNEFININFTNNEIQWLEKFEKEDIYAIQIGQEYNSTTYADFGYLFLLVDMTRRDEPQIKVRTWQPEHVPLEQRYHAGDFFNQ